MEANTKAHPRRARRSVRQPRPNWEMRFVDLKRTRANCDADFHQQSTSKDHVEQGLSDPENTYPKQIQGRVCVEALEAAAASFVVWRPEIEDAICDIKMEIHNIVKHWNHAVIDTLSHHLSLMTKHPGIMGSG